MIIIGILVALATILSAGFGVMIFALPHSTRINAIESACFAWLLGTAVISLLLWLFGLAVSSLTLQAIVTIIAVLLGAFGWRLVRRTQTRFYLPVPRTALEWTIALAIACEIAAATFITLKHPLGWDGSFNWEIKAHYAFVSDGTIPLRYYASPSQSLTHPEYPLLIPLTQLWFYLWMGEPNQFWIKLVFAIFYACAAILVAVLGTRLTGKRWVGGLAAAILFFVPYVVRGPGGVLGGYVDIPMAAIYLAAITALLSVSSANRDRFRLYILATSLLPWIKAEGVVLWFIAACCGLLVASHFRFSSRHNGGGTDSPQTSEVIPKLALIAFVPGALIFGAWHLFLRVAHARPPHDFTAATLNNAARIGPIFHSLLSELVTFDRWSLLWLLAALAIVLQLFRRRDITLLILSIAMIAPMIAYSCAYIFSAWPDYQAHLRYSLPRLLLHVTPLACVVIALTVSPGESSPNESDGSGPGSFPS